MATLQRDPRTGYLTPRASPRQGPSNKKISCPKCHRLFATDVGLKSHQIDKHELTPTSARRKKAEKRKVLKAGKKAYAERRARLAENHKAGKHQYRTFAVCP